MNANSFVDTYSVNWKSDLKIDKILFPKKFVLHIFAVFYFHLMGIIVKWTNLVNRSSQTADYFFICYIFREIKLQSLSGAFRNVHK